MAATSLLYMLKKANREVDELMTQLGTAEHRLEITGRIDTIRAWQSCLVAVRLWIRGLNKNKKRGTRITPVQKRVLMASTRRI